MRRFAVVALLILSGVAAGADQKYVQPQFTNCWNCHAPGIDVPHMDPPFLIVPLQVEAQVGQTFTLQAHLVTTWLAELRDAYVTLDLRNASSLAFVGAMEPVDRTWHGNITAPPTGLLQVQRHAQEVEVPAGATDVRITVAPDARGTTAPDLTLRVRADGTDVFVVDDAGAGQPESVHLASLAEVMALGYGTWEVVAEMTPVRADGLTSGTAWGYTTRLEAWGNASLERQQVALDAGVTKPGNRGIVQWPLIVQQTPQPGETIALTANVTLYYEHQVDTGDDWENVTIDAAAVVRQAGGGASMGTAPAGGVVPVPVDGVSFATISEAIGYAAAFLLVTSMLTGGVFGKGSRRHLNSVFGSARRRVAFHNFLSYGIVVAALAHMVIFVVDAIEPDYPWQRGVLLGGAGILCMLGLGVTGAMQVPMIRRWDYATWRWVHLGLALATVAFTVGHVLLDGAHFADVQDAVGWKDPLVPDERR